MTVLLDCISHILVQTTFDAIHNWPEAPNVDAYLRNPHRHAFTIKLRIQVFHDDRELEFNFLKRWLDRKLVEEFARHPIDGTLLPDLDTLSCERLASRVLAWANGSSVIGHTRELSCEVLEDGLMGATVRSLPSRTK